ncbi:adenosylcobalamin-dependent ribonucleoside-diphosphate reductase [Pseudosulfitobacter pseudonitzschiae]|uniref:adenosylcobalamin-dependent ribonucleoside-diphosphate reductase n=1 Tax=Pseudosulfitobacter pseudonitzschiae TaxID=1402135 RepID=UPI003B78E893
MNALAKTKPDVALPAISSQIWDMKYQFKDIDGSPIDLTVEDSWRRIAKALAEAEGENIRAEIEDTFYEALEDYKYLPAGRITAGAGTGRNVTLFNCFVMGTIPDSMPGIFDMLKEAALTMQQGGGIGYDFSTIRPKGVLVRGVGSDASGPLSFMDVWNAMCKTIMSAGSRRGAMMATMDCSHPDIEDFITAKKDAARLRHFNLSVLISDPFMKAVKVDGDWDLVWDGKVHKTLRARDLWNQIMQSTFDFAEPGVIFIDRINERNPLRYIETIRSTNPCGEQPLPPYGACLLGSINMARLVANPFSEEAHLDVEELNRIVAKAVRMMDNVVDVSRFALPEQEVEAKNKRRIGLGVTGVADALLMLKLTYGTEKAANQLEAWMRALQHAAYRASVELAKEKGAFPLFDADKYLESPTIRDLDQDLQDDIREYGIRNALLTSIAPTGTISLYAGNVSSGIEPVFAYSYTRKVLQKDGSRTEEEVVDYAVALYRQMFDVTDDADLPDYFVSAQTLEPLAHVRMQAAAQKWVDSSISKTINCPEDISFEDFKEVYMEAFDSGCKGCTTYRPNDITGSVLSVSGDAKNDEITTEAPLFSSSLLERTEALHGTTYKLKWPELEHAFYITVNDAVMADGSRRPFELFVNTKNIEAKMWIDALTLMITAVFRRTEDPSFVADELEGVFDARGGAFMPGKGYVKSLVAAIGGVLRQHFAGLGIMEAALPKGVKVDIEVPSAEIPDLGAKKVQRDGCPDYGNCDIIRQGGCSQCQSCAWSACS